MSQPLSLKTRMIIGAIVGLAVVTFFLSMSNGGHPSWGRYWMIRPIIVLAFAGTMAGVCNYVILQYRGLVGLNRILAVVASCVVSIVGLWMGIVLGFHGTMWN